jgi:hypothetical protein
VTIHPETVPGRSASRGRAMAPLTILWLVTGDDTDSEGRRVPRWLGVDGHMGRTWLYVGAAAFCLVTLPFVIRGLTAAQMAFGRSPLTRQYDTSSTVRRELESIGSRKV